MSEMIKRVRAAVQAALYEYEQSTMQFKSSMVARAAIEAMREPTDEMRSAFFDVWRDNGEENPDVVWEYFINAALSEKP